MNHTGAEGGPTDAVSENPVRIVEKPAETDREATSRYFQPYYELANHTGLFGLTPTELEAVAVLREGVTFEELNRKLVKAKQDAPFGFDNVMSAWVKTLEPLVGIREDAVVGFGQKLRKAHLDNRHLRKG